MAIAIIVGILAGTWLAEYGGHTRYGAVVRFLNDVLLSAPSILVGLFVYELLVRPFEGFSGYAGAVELRAHGRSRAFADRLRGEAARWSAPLTT